MGRCDGWGCLYSHDRGELAWTDEEIHCLVHSRLQLIDAYNGRLARNPPAFPLFAQNGPCATTWVPQAYPTPPSDFEVDPTNFNSEPLDDTSPAQHSSGNLNVSQIPRDIPTKEIPTVSVYLAPDMISAGVDSPQGTTRNSGDIPTTPVTALSPLAPPFVPSAHKQPPAVTPTEEPEAASSPTELRVPHSTSANAPSEATVQYVSCEEEAPVASEEMPNVVKTATKDDIASWDVAQTTELAWDVAQATELAWDAASTNESAWDTAPTNESAWDTAPTNESTWYAMEASEPTEDDSPIDLWAGYSRSKATEGRGAGSAKDTPNPPAPTQKGKNKMSTKPEKASFRRRESRQSTSSGSLAKKDEKRRPLVTVHDDDDTSNLWKEKPPHQKPKDEGKGKAKEYKISVRPGYVPPSKTVATVIAKAHIQLEESKSPSICSTPVTEERPEVDPGMNWVNGGPQFVPKPDPPRDFSQRSRIPGLAWGKANDKNE